jgi:SpoVK/Ycf46/Vps4 family AAA+-type ATPase
LHLVFSGSPGTGKTTVARLVARLYAATGALPGSTLTEVGRSDLVGAYVGQTALKTSRVVEKTVPGVLFIDEAYSLRPSHDSDYGAEAIATLVKEMEDRRLELAVIIAGYPREMADLLEANPGLRSRLKTFIHFPDYAPAELVQIFSGFANATGLALPSETLTKAEEVFEQAVRRDDFGNARFARSLFEGAYARMALRAAADGDMCMNELMELAPEDLDWHDPSVEVANQRRIGFADSESAEVDPEKR